MEHFQNIAGHDVPKRYFCNFLDDIHKMPHTLLLTGPPGVGKFALSLEFARLLNCRKTGEVSCDCINCHQIRIGTFSDLLISSSVSEIKADQMRQLIGDATISPRESVARIVILDDFDRVNEVASNIFLKTLEEPPEFLHFILISARPDKLLPTVLSRCINIEFRPLPTPITINAIKMVFPEKDEELICKLAQTGRVGSAIRELYSQSAPIKASKKKDADESYWEMIENLLQTLILNNRKGFAHNLKQNLKNILDSVETSWNLRGEIPIGMDLENLRRFVSGEKIEFSPVNYLLDENGNERKLKEYEKALLLIEDLLSSLYTHFTLETSNESNRSRILELLSRGRQIRMDLNLNRNIELSFERLLINT